MNTAIKLLTFAGLTICMITDMKDKTIRTVIPVVLIVITGLYGVFFQRSFLPDAAGGFLTGMAILAAAWLTREKIGIGDGLIFCTTGLLLGFWKNLNLIFFTFLLASITGCILLALKKIDRQSRIPLVPYIWICFIGVLWI